jgi:hypothetical protein
LTQWLNQLPFASVLNGPIKINILLELQAGRLLRAKARKLAAEVQAICSTSKTFRPMVYVETEIGWGWYVGPDANVQVWPPAAFSSGRITGRPTEDEVWKGWVVTKRTLTPENQKEPRQFTPLTSPNNRSLG